MAAEEARHRAEMLFKNAQRGREGTGAMADYQANAIAVRANMARLKALRLAKEANARPAPRRLQDE